MRYRKFGRTGWQVSEIGHGTWGIGKTWWGSTDDKESIRALQMSYDLGINFFDTAYVYGDGHSEQIIAQALGGKEVYVATKIPPKNRQWPGSPKSPVSDVFPRDWIQACTERSLKNLKRDTIDLTQFHVWSDSWLDQGDWLGCIARLKREGKIRAFGVSINDHDPNSALKLVASGVADSVQVIFNIFDQSPADRLFPLCAEHQVAVIARVPFDEGGLSGTLTVDTTFGAGDFRSSYFGGGRLLATVKRADRLKEWLGPEATTLPELALKFILAHPEVSTVIPGMRRVAHVKQNAAVSAERPLGRSTLSALRRQAWPRNYYGMWK